MRYQLAAENPEEEHALNSFPAARVLFDPFVPVLQARALMAAADLGVFEALERKEHRASELAEELSLDAGALILLLRILVCAGYVSRDDQVYSLTDLSRATLLPRSPVRLASWVRFNYKHWEAIGRMEDVLRTGKGIDPKRFLTSRKDWAIQQEAMLETARPAALMVAAQIPIREGAEKMLDLGGSHGLYGAEICRLHPPMRSVVIELPEAIDPARDLAHREGISDLVSHRSGNVLRRGVPGKHRSSLQLRPESTPVSQDKRSVAPRGNRGGLGFQLSRAGFAPRSDRRRFRYAFPHHFRYRLLHRRRDFGLDRDRRLCRSENTSNAGHDSHVDYRQEEVPRISRMPE